MDLKHGGIVIGKHFAERLELMVGRDTWYGRVWLQSLYAEDECSVVPDILYNSGVTGLWVGVGGLKSYLRVA